MYLDISVHPAADDTRISARTLSGGTPVLEIQTDQMRVIVFGKEGQTAAFLEAAKLLSDAVTKVIDEDEPRPCAMPAGYAEDAGSGP